jgi:hypothetical protein
VQSTKSATTGKDLLEEVNKCGKAGTEFWKVVQCDHWWVSKLDRQKKTHFEKDTRSSSWAEPRSENDFPALLKMSHVVDTVANVVNFTRANALNTSTVGIESGHTYLPYHTNVRWLSLGKVL